MKLDLLKSLTL